MRIEKLLGTGYQVEAGDTAAVGGGADTTAGGKDQDTVAGADKGGAGKTLLEDIGKGGGQDTAAGGGGDDTTKGSQGTDNLSPDARALQAAEKDTRRPKNIPAKYWNAEKGEINVDAWAKSTQALEQRMRDVGLPPETADAYKFEVPKEMKEAGIDLDPGLNKAFRTKALELGFTQKQYEGAMNLYFEHMASLANQTQAFSTEKAKIELLGYYKSEPELQRHVKLAYQAFSAYADQNDMDLIDRIGNIPAVVRILAKVGAELQEDPGVHPDAILDSESLDQLMRGAPGKEDSPYWNKEDPRHKATVAKVQRHHEARAASQKRKAA